jgi:hypothetical protein
MNHAASGRPHPPPSSLHLRGEGFQLIVMIMCDGDEVWQLCSCKLADRRNSMDHHANVGVFGDETKTDMFRSVVSRH